MESASLSTASGIFSKETPRSELFRPGDGPHCRRRIHGIQTGMAVCYENLFPKDVEENGKGRDDPRPRARFLAEEAYLPAGVVLSAARAIENGICKILCRQMAGT